MGVENLRKAVQCVPIRGSMAHDLWCCVRIEDQPDRSHLLQLPCDLELSQVLQRESAAPVRRGVRLRRRLRAVPQQRGGRCRRVGDTAARGRCSLGAPCGLRSSRCGARRGCAELASCFAEPLQAAVGCLVQSYYKRTDAIFGDEIHDENSSIPGVSRRNLTRGPLRECVCVLLCSFSSGEL